MLLQCYTELNNIQTPKNEFDKIINKMMFNC